MTAIDSLFDKICRLGNDSCDLTNRNIENNRAANYILENYSQQSAISNIINLATNQPNVFYKGGKEGGQNGECIDANSRLKFAQSTRTRQRNNQQERLFNTVPYLGKGKTNAVLETQMKVGDMVVNKKSQDPNSEINLSEFNYYPLIPSIEATISNPANLVEGVAVDGWVRGGVPTRDLTCDEESALIAVAQQDAIMLQK